MNTVKSVYYGWGTLIVAGGGAYYFAKRSINADRAHKAELDRIKRQRTWELENSLNASQSTQRTATTPLNPTATTAPKGVVAELERRRGGGGEGEDGTGPAGEASRDPAPTRHEAVSEEQRVGEKSKYEASEAYRSRRGDRFS
ncbi:hypothetical protein T440DRAFT_472861 [Plenodomus tracheiphilus IPT5]|uniref:Uncharacterized protein n=1 Tax=Plenodomus tracheiphilus IPT5 TaxID=1408161 RepID=A0A6A7APC5_9PLEO|nr:hypothetical protein T440DRAFT_472861 [Plenodomus tracheiphilus IPT5]